MQKFQFLLMNPEDYHEIYDISKIYDIGTTLNEILICVKNALDFLM